MGECEKGRVSAVMQTHSDGAGCEAQNILFKWRRSLKNLQNIAEGPVSSAETLLMRRENSLSIAMKNWFGFGSMRQ